MKKAIISSLAIFTLMQADTLYKDKSGQYFVVDDKHVICSKKATENSKTIKLLEDIKKDISAIKKCVKISDLPSLPKKSSTEPTTSFDANIRTGHINYKALGSTATNSESIGGYIGFIQKSVLDGIDLRVAMYGINALSNSNNNNDFLMQASNTTSSFGFIGEASLFGTFGDHYFNFGRQKIALPHADDDDIRMMPNLFEAYKYTYKKSLDFIHISSMAGWENGVDQTQFVSTHTVLGITDAGGRNINKGISVAHTKYANKAETFTFDIFDFYVHDAVNTIYFETGYETQFDNSKLSLVFQFDQNIGVKDFTMGGTLYTEFDAVVIGASASLELPKQEIVFSIAMNQVSGTNSPIGSLGGGAYFTSMEDSTIDAIDTTGSDVTATAYIFKMEFPLSNLLDGLTLEYDYGFFTASDKTLAEHSEQNIIVALEKEDKYTLSIAYAFIDNAPGTSAADYNQFRAFLDIPLKSQ